MKLNEYLVEQAMSQSDFAKKLGVVQGLVWQWLHGRTRITAERAVEIERVTDGKVARHELRPDLFSAPETSAR
jgi:DNA-binding transcriptional regulator YdaS (Cro superfamily)